MQNYDWKWLIQNWKLVQVNKSFSVTILKFYSQKKSLPLLEGIKQGHEVNAKSLSAIFVRQIGHSEQASEHDLHTAKDVHHGYDK